LFDESTLAQDVEDIRQLSLLYFEN